MGKEQLGDSTKQIIADDKAAFPKFPNVKVQLVGQNGNSFVILGLCGRAAKKAGLTKEQIDEFHKEAMGGDYDNLLCTCMKWFDVS